VDAFGEGTEDDLSGPDAHQRARVDDVTTRHKAPGEATIRIKGLLALLEENGLEKR
jgi:hypothetical protein